VATCAIATSSFTAAAACTLWRDLVKKHGNWNFDYLWRRRGAGVLKGCCAGCGRAANMRISLGLALAVNWCAPRECQG
jgi:hypothetical protein